MSSKVRHFTSKPNSRHFKLTYLICVTAGGSAVSAVIRMIGGILQARLVNPSLLGLFNGIGLVLGYASFFQLGISNGLNRELPYYIGKNDRSHANELSAATQAWVILIGSTAVIALMIVAGFQFFKGNKLNAAGWCAHAGLIFLLFYSSNYLQVTYRTAHDFARLALIDVIHACVALLLLVLVWLLNFYGLCLRAVLSAFVAASLFYYWRPVRVRPQWNFGHLKHLFAVGAPIFMVGQVYSWWSVIDRTLVLSYTGTYGMGLYAMVTMVSETMMLLPKALSQVIYPRMAEQFGRNKNLEDLTRMAIKPMFFSALCMVPIVVGTLWVVEPAVRLLVPKYIEALPAIRWALLQSVIMCFAPINNVYNVTRRQDLYFISILSGMVSYGASLIWFIRDDVYLCAFPKAMLVGYFSFILASYALLFYLKGKNVS